MGVRERAAASANQQAVAMLKAESIRIFFPPLFFFTGSRYSGLIGWGQEILLLANRHVGCRLDPLNTAAEPQLFCFTINKTFLLAVGNSLSCLWKKKKKLGRILDSSLFGVIVLTGVESLTECEITLIHQLQKKRSFQWNYIWVPYVNILKSTVFVHIFSSTLHHKNIIQSTIRVVRFC